MSTISASAALRTGIVKRADALTMAFEDINVKPGFNKRDTDNEDFKQSVVELASHINGGGYYPPLLVSFSENDNYIVDGHRRYYALQQLRDAGVEIGRIKVDRFEGDDADATATILTSADARSLSPLEQAAVVLELLRMGKTTKEVAAMVNKTVSRVEQLQLLGFAPDGVKEKIKAGKVSAAHATETVRKHGIGAELILDIQEKEAKAQGKEKITAKTLAPYKPKAADYEEAVKTFYAALHISDKDIFSREEELDLSIRERAILNLFKMAGVDYKTLPIEGE